MRYSSVSTGTARSPFARLGGGGSARCFLVSLTLIGEYLTSVIGQEAVVFPCFSPAVQLKIDAVLRFSLIEFVLNRLPAFSSSLVASLFL